MIDQALQKPVIVTQIFPEKEQAQLENLYLRQGLAGIASQSGKSLVVTDFLTDRNGVIAKANQQHQFKVPLELRNQSDWRLFQELLAQSDVIISGSAYLKRLSAIGSQAEDVLCQFEPGSRFEDLGVWRLNAGYKKRSPDLAIVAHNLDFKIPERLLIAGRKIIVFTTFSLADSARARALHACGVIVVGSGKAGVEGNGWIDWLGDQMGYRVILMTTGPSVLKLLLDAKRLDIFYLTEAQMEIPFDNPQNVRTIFPDGKKVNQLEDFKMVHQYCQEDVVTENGAHIAQNFLRFDRKRQPAGNQ